MRKLDHYQILEISKDSSHLQIKTAYKKLALVMKYFLL